MARNNGTPGAFGRQGDSLFAELQREAAERRAAEAAERVARQVAFRRDQASLALTLLGDELYTTARTMAEYTIAYFVDVRPPEGMSRTNAAAEKAKAELTDDERGREKAVNYGIMRARKALREAYDQLTSQRNARQDEQPAESAA